MKRLLLLRHAEAEAAPPGGGDHGRPLTPAGFVAAAALGHFLDAQGCLADLALSSDARRAQETLDGLSAALRVQPEARFDAAIYRADAEELLAYVQAHGGAAHCLLVVGHNPAIGELARALAQRGDEAARTGLARGFPPAGLAIFGLTCAAWEDLGPRCAALERFVTPAMLPPARGR